MIFIFFFKKKKEVNFCPMNISDHQAMATHGYLCWEVKGSFGWFLHGDAALRSV